MNYVGGLIDLTNIEMPHSIHVKRELKRIDWSIVQRIITLLHDENQIKKTNLAMKCSLGYDKCILYLEWMNMMSLINRTVDTNGYELISLQDKGRELFQKRFHS